MKVNGMVVAGFQVYLIRIFPAKTCFNCMVNRTHNVSFFNYIDCISLITVFFEFLLPKHVMFIIVYTIQLLFTSILLYICLM